MRRRKVCVVTEARATYGYSRPIMKLLQTSPDVDLAVVVTGMHLLRQYGLTVQEIEQDEFPIAARVDMSLGGDTPTAWAKSLGVGIQSLAQVFEVLQPDIVLVSGDRGEVLAAVVAASYMNIAVAHIQSGDLSGHIDGAARHAITKLCHIHFPSCEDSAERVRKMGEELWRIFNVGAPQLDEIIFGPRVRRVELSSLIGMSVDDPFAVVVQHAVLAEVRDARRQMTETMEAVKASGLPAIVIYPNVDAASAELIDVIDSYADHPGIRVFPTIERVAFITLLEHASVLVGNSSAGILEAPSFKLGAVNIGTRQRGRLQASNVVNVDHDRKAIRVAIETILHDHEYKQRLENCINPYGDGRSSAKIVDVLTTIGLDDRLLHKTMTY